MPTSISAFETKLVEFLAYVEKDQVWVILDIDRVLINTTAWYWACTTPDLLISSQHIPRFQEINTQTFGTPQTLTESKFRKATLGLLERIICPQALHILSTSGVCASKLYPNIPVNHDFLNSCGKFIASRVHVYDAPVRYLTYLNRYYGKSLRVLFLTAGYLPFMQGLIDRIAIGHHLDTIKYHIFGSGIEFNHGIGRETFYCIGKLKQSVAEGIVSKQASIVFAADNDVRNGGLLHFVRKNGGHGLAITHEPNNRHNKTWLDFFNNILPKSRLTYEFEYGDHIFSRDRGIDESQYRHIVDTKLKGFVNKIGIPCLGIAAANKALNTLATRVNDHGMLKEIILKLIFQKDGIAYLRGKLFYHWLPTYISLDTRTKLERWQQKLTLCRIGLNLLLDAKIQDLWTNLGVEEQLLVLCLADHYKNAIYVALNTVYKTSILEPEAIGRKCLDDLEVMARSATILYYALLFDSVGRVQRNCLIKADPLSSLTDLMRKHSANQEGMRELDDPYVISLSVLSLLDQICSRGCQYGLLLDFPCGGLELGLAFSAIAQLLYPSFPIPEVAHCFYSSRKNKRENLVQNHKDTGRWLLDFIPYNFHERVEPPPIEWTVRMYV